jgi:hypothetical protein
MLMWGSEAGGRLASRGSCSQVPPALLGGVHALLIIHRLTVEMKLEMSSAAFSIHMFMDHTGITA